jgi:peptidoglycan/LPS O-acetylase OafA/YrhL
MKRRPWRVNEHGASMNKAHSDEIPALTGLRFLAAFSIVIAHGTAVLMHGHERLGSVAYWCTQASDFGMALFFVLSGFVIHYNYGRQVTEGRLAGIAAYLWARFARLYPLFLLTLLGYVLVSRRHFEFWSGHPDEFRNVLQALPYFLFSVQSWFYVPVGDTTLIFAIGGATSLTWSISTEWFFYLLYPLVAWLILRSRAPWLTVVAVLAWCVLWIAISTSVYDRGPVIDAWAVERYGPIAGTLQPQGDFATQNSFVFWLSLFSPYLRMGEFILGSLIAQLYVQLRSWKPAGLENAIGTGLFLAAAASIFAIGYLEYGPDVGMNVFRKMYMNFAVAPSVALLVFSAARYHNVFSQLLASRPFLVLGDASYSIYLVHYTVLMIATKLIGSAVHTELFNALAFILSTVAILLISILLYRCYEAPARTWLRQLWRDHPRRVATAKS